MNNKKQLYFILVLTTSALSLLSGAFLFLYINHITYSTIFAVVMIISFFLVIKFNSMFEYYKHESNYFHLLKHANPNFPIKYSFFSSVFKDQLIRNQFKLFTKKIDYTLYYVVDSLISSKKRDKTLYVVLLIHNNSLSFQDTDEIYSALEHSIFKKHKYRHRIIYQIKEYEELSPSAFEDANKIFFISNRKQNIYMLNVVFSVKNMSAYFLHSSTYKFSRFQIHTDETLMRLLNGDIMLPLEESNTKD